jgi:hypothetical protein
VNLVLYCLCLLNVTRLATKATDEIKVFSRNVPWEALGREKDVRVFVARTLNPGEVPPPPASLAAALLARKAEEDTKPDAPLSRKQRKLRERAQRAKALRAAAVAEAKEDGTDQQQQQEDLMVAEEMLDISTSKSTAGGPLAAAAVNHGATTVDIPAVNVNCAASSITSFSTGNYTSSNSSYKGQSPSNSPFANAALAFNVEQEGPRIHGCVVFDPIYQEGAVVGYTAERMFIHPQGSKGAIKHIQREALALLKAEGKELLNLGLAACYQIKEGEGSDPQPGHIQNAHACAEFLFSSFSTVRDHQAGCWSGMLQLGLGWLGYLVASSILCLCFMSI